MSVVAGLLVQYPRNEYYRRWFSTLVMSVVADLWFSSLGMSVIVVD